MNSCIDLLNTNFTFNNYINYLACNLKDFDDYKYINYEFFNNYNNFSSINNKFDMNYMNYTNYTNYMNYIDYIKNNYSEIFKFITIFYTIYLSDKFLVNLFGLRSRWYQLHTLVNIIVSSLIIEDYKNIILYPEKGYLIIKDHSSSYFIINLHIFHLLTHHDLGFYDYFHHILFVLCGVLPSVIFNKTNQCYLAYIPCSGIPGAIEYFILSLYKNNKISLIKQKYLNLLNYNYFRFPLCIFGVTYNFINYNNGNLKDNLYSTIYTNLLLFLNGALFNNLTLGSYYQKKYTKFL